MNRSYHRSCQHGVNSVGAYCRQFILTLIQYPAALGASSASPFCTKIEILLKMSGLEYGLEDMTDARKMPHSKLPVLEDGSELIPDSVCIREYLEVKLGANFDNALSAQERAVSHAFTRLCEEWLYWVILYSRWMDASNWAIIRQHFFGALPWPGRMIVSGIALKQVRQAFNGQCGRNCVCLCCSNCVRTLSLAIKRCGRKNGKSDGVLPTNAGSLFFVIRVFLKYVVRNTLVCISTIVRSVAT